MQLSSPHIDALHRRHAALERALHAEMVMSSPDMVRIAQIKRQKLRVKDELAGHMTPISTTRH